MGWREEGRWTWLSISVTFPPHIIFVDSCGGRGAGWALEEGKVLSKTQFLSFFGQWLTESRDPPLESFSASRGTKVSGARKTDGTVNLREGWGSACVRGCHVGILTVSVS